MSEITQQLDDLEDAPVNDSEFESELSQIRLHVNDLHAKAKNLGYANDTPTQEFRTIRDQVTAAEIYRREINKAFDNISTSTAAIKKKLAELVSTKGIIIA
jgi:predicted  nucleic acid-binding Zn-ribbon protein